MAGWLIALVVVVTSLSVVVLLLLLLACIIMRHCKRYSIIVHYCSNKAYIYIIFHRANVVRSRGALEAEDVNMNTTIQKQCRF